MNFQEKKLGKSSWLAYLKARAYIRKIQFDMARIKAFVINLKNKKMEGKMLFIGMYCEINGALFEECVQTTDIFKQLPIK